MSSPEPTSMSAMKLLEKAILDIECRLSLGGATSARSNEKSPPFPKKKAKQTPPQQQTSTAQVDDDALDNLPEICKLQFKVGQIVNVWNHPQADKLYCEEIDVGEESGPRQIASGLRQHFTIQQMKGQRLLVVTNLKVIMQSVEDNVGDNHVSSCVLTCYPTFLTFVALSPRQAKNLVKFKSNGMVLCAASKDGKVEFVEPPKDAVLGEIVTFQGLPTPQPASPSQVEKKKIFQKCIHGMKTNSEGIAVWDGHAFMTSAGPCRTKSICNGVLR